MPDNKQIKDGLGNLFTLRMRDISSQGDGSLQRSMFYATSYPIDYGPGGIFQNVAASGVMASSLPANSTIYSFWWGSTTMLAVISSVRIMAWTASATPFTVQGPAEFDFYAARPFTVQDTGGTSINLAGDTNQLRSSMNASQAAIEIAGTGGLNPGTRTLDAYPMQSQIIAVPLTLSTPFSPLPVPLFEKTVEEQHPLVLAGNEGFVINATVPAPGTWQFSITLRWAEVASY